MVKMNWSELEVLLNLYMRKYTMFRYWQKDKNGRLKIPLANGITLEGSVTLKASVDNYQVWYNLKTYFGEISC